MKVYTKAKCRNCGEIFILEEFSEVYLSKEEVIKLVGGSVNNRVTESPAVHECSNGELGIADGIALVLEENKICNT